MPQDRYTQISRYFTLRDPTLRPKLDNEDFYWRLEPIASILRRRFTEQVIPLSHVVINEAIQLAKNRSIHTIKYPGKPVSEGLKL
jgi:Transposase IS4